MLSTLRFANITSAVAEPILRKIYKHTGNHNYMDDLGLHRLTQNRFHEYQDDLQVIGVHLRHFDHASINDTSIDLRFDTLAGAALKIVRSYSNASRCAVLVAADRAAAIERVQAFSANMSCECYYIDRDMTAGPARDRDGYSYIEHGPW